MFGQTWARPPGAAPRFTCFRPQCNCRDDEEEDGAEGESPASKSVIFYVEGGEGLRGGGGDGEGDNGASPAATATPHMDAVVRDGCSGRVVMREPREGGMGQEGAPSEAVFLQLLGLSQSGGVGGGGGGAAVATLGERFVGMSAAVFTESPGVSAAARRAGLEHIEPLRTAGCGAAAVAAERILARLTGCSGKGGPLGAAVDVVFVHVDVGAGAPPREGGDDGGLGALQWADAVVGAVDSLGGREFCRNVLTVLLLAPRPSLPSGRPGACPASEAAAGGSAGPPELLAGLVGYGGVYKPEQSYQRVATRVVERVGVGPPAVAVYRMLGSTRRDGAQSLRTAGREGRCGNVAILGEHFLAEIAYKIGRSPKYGA